MAASESESAVRSMTTGEQRSRWWILAPHVITIPHKRHLENNFLKSSSGRPGDVRESSLRSCETIVRELEGRWFKGVASALNINKKPHLSSSSSVLTIYLPLPSGSFGEGLGAGNEHYHDMGFKLVVVSICSEVS
jgi:hypothetical protein